MHRRWALALGLLNVLLVGCLTGGSDHATAWRERLSLLHVPTGPDVVVLWAALVERPLGDRYLNQELWESADEQVIAAERRPALDANGFRVAAVGGIMPSRLQDLLASDRTCVNPRRIHVHVGNVTAVSLGDPVPQCRYRLRLNDQETPAELEQARCALLVRPTLTRDGKTALRFTPQVQHGETIFVPQPAADPAGVLTWALHEQRPTETYEELSWEVVVAPSELVVVGTRFDRPDTLGYQCLTRRDTSPPVQRLLVIRTGRPADALPEVGPAAAEADDGAPPPLAYQAGCTAVLVEDQ